ncbi:MAG: hypothetical protein WD827_06830 [Solirubrobacterales bacterium]
MPLDGLRAWISEVERKLGIRSRVFLVLVTIAIGGAGAAIYLAIDTRDNAVSESDVQALQGEIEGQVGGTEIGALGSAAAQVSTLEAELKALQAQVQALEGEGGGTSSGGSQSGKGDNAAKSPSTGATGVDEAQEKVLEDLKRQAEEQQGK